MGAVEAGLSDVIQEEESVDKFKRRKISWAKQWTENMIFATSFRTDLSGARLSLSKPYPVIVVRDAEALFTSILHTH